LHKEQHRNLRCKEQHKLAHKLNRKEQHKMVRRKMERSSCCGVCDGQACSTYGGQLQQSWWPGS
jgi:hypothetical protein